MARKKPARPAARKAKRKAAPKTARRKAITKALKRRVRKAVKPLKKAAAKARSLVRKAAKTKTGKKARAAVGRAAKAAASTRAGKAVKKAVVTARAVKAGVVAALTPPKPAGARKSNIDRPRKTVADIHGLPSSLGMAGVASAAHSGRADLKEKLKKNTSASPALTAGDVDADWQSAETTGDEAPGGDNPTPDQDVVDEIGRALGVEYEDDEELQGGAEIAERDAHRWELDPSSKDDFDDEKE
jgi:hypothetical protein